MSGWIRSAALIGALWTMVSAAQALPPSVAAKISGPVAATAQSGEPYRPPNDRRPAQPGQTPPNLIPYDYVDEEYFVSGMVDGKPYTTPILVRKPRDPAKFSGVVVVETLHAQGNTPFWSIYLSSLLGAGHGWVLVDSQRAPLEAYVRKSNAARYAATQIPEAPGQSVNPVRSGPQDKVSEEILTQVGALLKSNGADTPFGGMTVKHLIMAGNSQTGLTTLWYIQDAHAKARMPDGRPIYDGYYPSEALTDTPIARGDAAVIHVVGEGDFAIFGHLAPDVSFITRPDGNGRNDRYREYQFPAAAHLPTRGLSDPRIITGVPGKPGEHLSQFPSEIFYRAAFGNLVDWVTKGIKPPAAPPIQMIKGKIVRDQFGNAKGGVRSPYVDVPIAHYVASAPLAANDNGARAMLGLQEPFSSEKLRSLYASPTEYLKRFNQGVDKMVSGRWISAKDGEALKKDVKALPVLQSFATAPSSVVPEGKP